MRTKTVRRVVALGAIGLGLSAVLAVRAFAVDTCNGFVNIDYVGNPPVTNIGDTVDMVISLGTGSITGGTKLTISSLQLNLDCNSNFPLTPPCHDEGAIIEYEGDSFLSTTCPATFTSNVPAGGSAMNQVIFTASTPIDIPANVPPQPGFCTITWRVKVLGTSIDHTPGVIEQLVGYDIAQCDNGVLLSGGFQTGDIGTPPPLHFSCYEIARGKIAPIAGVTLEDRFGSSTVTVTEAKRLCAPTDKNGETPGAENAPDHIVSYFITPTTSTFTKTNASVTTQFGALSATVVSPVFLFVPSAKSLTPPPPPPLASSLVPHFQCYKLSNVTGDKPSATVNLIDQFGPLSPTIDKRGPFRLCVPVNKNGGDPTAPTSPNALVCYTTKNDRLPFADKVVFVNNQFGPMSLKFTQYDELCVPGTLGP
jgi:hypothetical protein